MKLGIPDKGLKRIAQGYSDDYSDYEIEQAYIPYKGMAVPGYKLLL